MQQLIDQFKSSEQNYADLAAAYKAADKERKATLRELRRTIVAELKKSLSVDEIQSLILNLVDALPFEIDHEGQDSIFIYEAIDGTMNANKENYYEVNVCKYNGGGRTMKKSVRFYVGSHAEWYHGAEYVAMVEDLINQLG